MQTNQKTVSSPQKSLLSTLKKKKSYKGKNEGEKIFLLQITIRAARAVIAVILPVSA